MTEGIRENLSHFLDEEALFLEPAYFDQAIVGVSNGLVVYDKSAIIDLLQREDKMTYEDAIEHYEYNIAGSLGDHHPVYIELLNDLV